MMNNTNTHHPKKGERRLRQRQGFTLAEVMISVLIVMILATGTLGYQYTSTRNVKISEVQAAASRIGTLLLESWKGRQGDLSFDPVDVFASEMTLQSASVGPDVPDNSFGTPLVKLGSYEIILNDVYYYATLSYDAAWADEPMLLNVTVAWNRNYRNDELADDASFVRHSVFLVAY